MTRARLTEERMLRIAQSLDEAIDGPYCAKRRGGGSNGDEEMAIVDANGMRICDVVRDAKTARFLASSHRNVRELLDEVLDLKQDLNDARAHVADLETIRAGLVASKTQLATVSEATERMAPFYIAGIAWLTKVFGGTDAERRAMREEIVRVASTGPLGASLASLASELVDAAKKATDAAKAADLAAKAGPS